MVFAFWILVIVGSIGTVRSVVGLLIIVSLMRVVGPDTAMPTLVVNAGLLAVAVAQIGCGLSLRRGRRWPRTVVTVLPGTVIERTSVGVVETFQTLITFPTAPGPRCPHVLV